MSSYQRLKQPGQFSEDLLLKVLSGLSGRRYHETVTEIADGFGVSASSVSRRIVEATTKKLRQFKAAKYNFSERIFHDVVRFV